ncbi:hypothetical protein QTG54_005290 [Skeletonema marinoi]|uniref:tRNA pseudouridine synthase n=1 Tax=Skeletonema marinoi TaxID=267567 RepID=A0AAD8YCF8_9STRA|nr:hypothetical protein QTG54_005290 [Skeletonema marinoi]
MPVMMMSTSSAAADATHIKDESTDNVAQTTSTIDNNSFCYTTAILKVSYDGTHFSGWTGGNAGDQPNKSKASPKQQQSNNNKSTQQTQQRRSLDEVELSSVKNIIFEACSRTDAGVHATSLVAQFYCYNDQVHNNTNGNSTRYYDSSNSSIPIRPKGPTDASNFIQLPFNSDLSKLVYVLNRMLPPDVRVLAASPMPTVKSMSSSSMSKYSIDAFHPTLYTQSKTYVYRFSIGNIQDPLQSRFVWHLDGSSGRAMGMNGNKFDLDLAMQVANCSCVLMLEIMLHLDQ